MKSITLLFFVFAGFCVQGQDILTNTIKWNVTGTSDIDQGTSARESSSIISYPGKIEWKSNDGSLKETFTIVKADGGWTNIARSGQINYVLTYQSNKTATIQFVRDASGVHVRLVLHTDSAPEIFEMTIANTELL